jgi:murein DD-endopeptidase MepM/ murein hydrolase activator NlpD
MGTNIAVRPLCRILHWSVLSALAAAVAGCSAESTRLAENPNGNPYAPPPPGQYSANQYYAPPPTQTAAVQRQSLPQPQYAQQYPQTQYPPTQYAPTPQYAQPPYPQPQAAPHVAQAAPPHAATEVTGAVHSGYWDPEGGTVVVLAQGETVDIVARRWSVPTRAILQANNITSASAVAPGQRLVIPHYVVGGTGAKLAHAAAPRTPPGAAAPPAAPAPHLAVPPVAAAPAPHPAAPAVAAAPRPAGPALASVQPAAPAQASAPVGSGQTLLAPAPIHTVASGDTLGRIAHKYHVKVKDLAVANGLAPEATLKIGQQIAVPVKQVATPAKAPPGKPGAAVAAQGTATKPVVAGAPLAKPAAGGKMASAEPNARVATPVEAAPEETSLTPPNGAPAFRWPARGRVINGFGAKVNGATNDGIDLSVPEGTQIRAADDGVVAYAGNELKGYGNLVLVRHSNGFVTAYANASEILVKRNDQVHKGQVIVKSGQTGSASAPQLHFEIRKNSSPVDPMTFLPADKTASAPL